MPHVPRPMTAQDWARAPEMWDRQRRRLAPLAMRAWQARQPDEDADTHARRVEALCTRADWVARLAEGVRPVLAAEAVMARTMLDMSIEDPVRVGTAVPQPRQRLEAVVEAARWVHDLDVASVVSHLPGTGAMHAATLAGEAVAWRRLAESGAFEDDVLTPHEQIVAARRSWDVWDALRERLPRGQYGLVEAVSAIARRLP